MGRELTMDDCEIRRRHKWGCSIVILAELNACHQQTIREILWEVPEMSKIEWIKAKFYYNDGMNDREIAKLLGCSSLAVLQWRRRENLPAQCKKLIPSEATMAGAVIQSVAERKPATVNPEFEALFPKPVPVELPTIPEPTPED